LDEKGKKDMNSRIMKLVRIVYEGNDSALIVEIGLGTEGLLKLGQNHHHPLLAASPGI